MGLLVPRRLHPPAGSSPLNVSVPFLVFPKLYFSGDRDENKKSRDVTILPSFLLKQTASPQWDHDSGTTMWGPCPSASIGKTLVTPSLTCEGCHHPFCVSYEVEGGFGQQRGHNERIKQIPTPTHQGPSVTIPNLGANSKHLAMASKPCTAAGYRHSPTLSSAAG